MITSKKIVASRQREQAIMPSPSRLILPLGGLRTLDRELKTYIYNLPTDYKALKIRLVQDNVEQVATALNRPDISREEYQDLLTQYMDLLSQRISCLTKVIPQETALYTQLAELFVKQKQIDLEKIKAEAAVAIAQEKTKQTIIQAELKHAELRNARKARPATTAPNSLNAKQLDRQYFRSVIAGDIDRVDGLLLSGVTAGYTDKYGESALHKAVRTGKSSEKMILLLQDYGPSSTVANTDDTRLAEGNIEASTLGKKTALHLAVILRKPEIIQALLAKGENSANLQVQDIDGNTPLHLAAHRNWEEGITLLCAFHAQRKVSLDQRNKKKETPLHIAAYHGYVKTARNLLSAGSDINAVNIYEESPLHLASLGNQPEMITFLRGQDKLEVDLRTKADWREEHLGGSKTALHIAAAFDHEAAIKALLAKGPNRINPEAIDEAENTALHDAACQGHLDCVRLLVKHGPELGPVADIEAANKDGKTPLFKVAYPDKDRKGQVPLEKRLEIIKYLCDNNADVNTQKKTGYTPFHGVAARNEIRVLTMLLERGGGYKDTFDQWGETALHKAAMYGNPECALLLAKYGVRGEDSSKWSINLKSGINQKTGRSRGYTAIRFAVSKSAHQRDDEHHKPVDHFRVFRTVAALIDGGADITIADDRSDFPHQSAFVTACHWGLTDTVRLMLTTGLKEKQIRAGFAAARQNNQEQIINLLIETGVLPADIILSILGKMYAVPFSSGQHTLASLVSVNGLKRVLGVDDTGLKEIFATNSDEQEWKVRKESGSIVGLTEMQLLIILKALVKRQPEIADQIGLYNLRGSKRLYDVYGGNSESRKTGVEWIWTGEKLVVGQHEKHYPDEGLVTARELQDTRTTLCYRSLSKGDGGKPFLGITTLFVEVRGVVFGCYKPSPLPFL
jgi:ankyrin repeat protein